MIRFDEGISEQLREEAAEALSDLGVPSVSRVGILAGGGSNENLLVECGYGTVVLRIAEQDTGRFAMDRARGERAHRAAAAAGVAPELIAALPSGHSVTRFVEGEIVDGKSIKEPEVLRQVGARLRRLHGAGDTGEPASGLEDLRAWIRIAREEDLALPADFDRLDERRVEIEAKVECCEITPRLCHNDIQLQNMIRETGELWFLDFEYAGMGDPYFDLGMLFVNGSLERAEQDLLLEAYFGEVREEDRSWAELQTFISALRDAVWALVAGSTKTDHGDLFDYDGWSKTYFGRARTFVESGRYRHSLQSV